MLYIALHFRCKKTLARCVLDLSRSYWDSITGKKYAQKILFAVYGNHKFVVGTDYLVSAVFI